MYKPASRVNRTLWVGLMLLTLGGYTWAEADDYANQWGPRTGTPMPVLAAMDHTGKARTLADLSGKNGLLIFINRSADW